MGRVGAAELGTQQRTTDGRDATFHQNYYYYSEPCVNNNNNNFRSTPRRAHRCEAAWRPAQCPVGCAWGGRRLSCDRPDQQAPTRTSHMRHGSRSKPARGLAADIGRYRQIAAEHELLSSKRELLLIKTLVSCSGGASAARCARCWRIHRARRAVCVVLGCSALLAAQHRLL